MIDWEESIGRLVVDGGIDVDDHIERYDVFFF